MRTLYLGIALFLVANTANAATLHLPRLFDPSEMGTIGVAFVNPTLTTATATLRWKTAQGETSLSTQRTIPAKGQLALTLNQLFPEASIRGWLAADIDLDQVSGFWLCGDFVTSTDGTALLSSSNAIAYPVFPFFARASEISFANLGSSTLTGNLRLFNASGTNVASVPFSVPASGVFQRSVESLFPNQAGSFDSGGYWISVSSGISTAKVIGTAVTPIPNSDNWVANAAYIGSTHFLFPQVVDGPIGGAIYDSLLTLTNFQSTSQTVTLTLRQASGPALTAHRTIPGYGVLRSSVASLLEVPLLDGWLDVESPGGMAGTLTYTDRISGGSTAVDMQTQSIGETGLIFGHIADLSPWWTGIALANSSTTSAQIEVYAIDSAGNLIGGPNQSTTASFTLAGQTKKAFLLGDVIPQMQTRQTDGGYVFIRVTNGVKIHGTELFFLRNGRVYTNVPATRLAGIGFTAPPAAANVGLGGTISVEETFVGDSNQQPVTSFRAGTTITLNMRVNNTTGRTINCTRQYRAIGPFGYSLAFTSVAGDQATGRTTRFTNVEIPAGAPEGNYTFTASVDCNGVISSRSTGFAGSGGSIGGGGDSGGGGGSIGGGLRIRPTDFEGDRQNQTGCVETSTGRSVVNARAFLAEGGAPLSGYTWTVAPGYTLPPGTTIDPLTGIFKIEGPRTRLIPGTHSFGIQVSDDFNTAMERFVMVVDAIDAEFLEGVGRIQIPCPVQQFQQPYMRTINLPVAKQGQGYGASLEIYLGFTVMPGTGEEKTVAAGPLSWSVANGQVPPGMFVDQSRGVLRGTPFSSAAGNTYRFRVKVTSRAPETQGAVAACLEGGCPEYVINVQ